jgi:hypothetical protein
MQNFEGSVIEFFRVLSNRSFGLPLSPFQQNSEGNTPPPDLETIVEPTK